MFRSNAMTASLATVLTTAITLGFTAGTAAAADTPKDAESCLEMSLNLAAEAQKKGVSGDAAKKADALLEKLEGQCDAKDFKGAAKTAGELETVIGG